MPCWARASTSLICFVFAAVSSSSSLARSRIGSVCRATYFLRANGFTRPQKPSRASGCNGCLPLAVVADDVWEVDCVELCVAVAGAVELCVELLLALSCAKTGRASIAHNTKPRRVRFFIYSSSNEEWVSLRAPNKSAFDCAVQKLGLANSLPPADATGFSQQNSLMPPFL